MIRLTISTTRKNEVVDVTEDIQNEITKQNSKDGLCHVFALHTTCSVTTADLDPGTDMDLLEALRKLLPEIKYRHPHDPSHTPDHILSSIIGPSVIVPIQNGQLELGTWQRIILVELDGPRERKLCVTIVNSK